MPTANGTDAGDNGESAPGTRRDVSPAFDPRPGGDGYTMFQDLEQISTTMTVDNEVVMRYIEEDLGGVIPESYSQAQGRIVQTGEALAAAA